MFDPQDNRWDLLPARRGAGGGLLRRVAWVHYRWGMIQFAKFVLVQFDIIPDPQELAAVVDAWLEDRRTII